MIEKKTEVKKPEPQKSSFNSLSMKLVKPPEKKPAEKKVPIGPGAVKKDAPK